MKRSVKFLSSALLAALFTQSWAATAIRTATYNTVTHGNIAVDYTLNDYLSRPHLIEHGFVAGQFSLPVIGASANSAASFSAMGLNWLAALDNSLTTLRVRAGVGINNVFGAGILYELNSYDTSTDNGTTQTKNKWNYIGDGIGIFGSYNLMDWSSLYAEITFADGYQNNSFDVETKNPDASSKLKNYTRDIIVGMRKDAKEEESHAFGVQLNLTFNGLNGENKTSTGTVKTADQGSLEIGIDGMYGFALKKSDDLGLFLGCNSGFSYLSYNNKMAGATPEDSSVITVNLTPNIAFRKVLGKGFEAQFGASSSVIQWIRNKDKTGLTENVSSLLLTPTANANVGLRWVLDNLAVEGVLNNTLLLNGPAIIGGGTPGMFGSVGVSLGF